jgi:hypothetical protein
VVSGPQEPSDTTPHPFREIGQSNGLIIYLLPTGVLCSKEYIISVDSGRRFCSA